MSKEYKYQNTIIFDLDKTLCTKKKPDETYKDVKPIKEMINLLNELHDKGYFIVIETARNMLTQNNDESKVIQNVGEDTLKWLRENNVKYDGIKFAKTYGEFYVDDKSIRPSELYKLGIEGVKTILDEESKFMESLYPKEENK